MALNYAQLNAIYQSYYGRGSVVGVMSFAQSATGIDLVYSGTDGVLSRTVQANGIALHWSGPETMSSVPVASGVDVSIPASGQVNSDWNATSGVAQVLNKPTLAASATTDTTNASNISAGTLAEARLPTNALKSDVADQLITGGANITPANLGTISAGTLALDCGKCAGQFLTNGGAFTLSAPTVDGFCVIMVTNNATAGAITFSGFSVGLNTGDSLDTTNGHGFEISIRRINGISKYSISANQ